MPSLPRPRNSAVLAPLLGLLLWAGPAWADPKDDARRYFIDGLAAAEDGRFEDALESFLAAQDAYPHPATLHNIARSYADLGQLEDAIEYYELYQAAAPDKAADVAPVLAVLEARLRKQQAPPPAPAAGPVTEAGATATAAVVARLQAIAAELASLTADLEARAATPAAGDPVELPRPDDGASDPAPVDADAPLPEGAAMLDDAYERVVVTASRYGQSPLDSPSTVTILTAEDIRLSGAATLPDVLRRVAGIDVMYLSASQPDVSVRGFNRELSNKVLVLIDGRSFYLDMLGTLLWETLPIALEEIERVEVIRGPGSAVYGANAVTGVINIITRAPGSGDSLVVGEIGTSGYKRGEAVATGRRDRTAWRVSAGYHELGRWETEADPDRYTALRPFQEDDTRASEALRANARVDRTFGDKAFASLQAGHARGFTEYYVFGALGDYVTGFEHTYARGDAGYGPLHLRSFYNRWAGPTGPWLEFQGERSLWTDYDAQTFDVELEVDQGFSTGGVDHRVNAGVSYRYKVVEWGYLQGDGAPIDENHVAAFLQETARMGPVSVVGSLRFDRHPLVDPSKTISPRAAAIVRVAPDTSLRINGGTSFRNPSFMESYLDMQQGTEVDGLYIQTDGNPELSPERILTGELGVHDASSSFHEADLATYVSRVTDLIYVTDVVPGITPYDSELDGFAAGTTAFGNLDPTYLSYGVEAEGRFFPVVGLDLYANAAVERVTETEDGTTVTDGSTSLFKGNAGAMYRSPWRVDGGAHLHFASAQTWRLREYDTSGQLVVQEASIPARAIASAELAARPFADEALELSLSAWNIGALISGRGVQEHPKGQRVGSRVFGSATWRF